jgi:hypothetical protein
MYVQSTFETEFQSDDHLAVTPGQCGHRDVDWLDYEGFKILIYRGLPESAAPDFVPEFRLKILRAQW